MLARVSSALFDDSRALKLYTSMYNLDFFPNSPALRNLGDPEMPGLPMACFVLQINDSLDSIYETLGHAAKVHQSGGGTGFCFSTLRPANWPVKSTKGVASGPLGWLDLYDRSTSWIKQGCFVGSTLVATADGPVRIKDLKAGTLVYAWDGKFVLRPCTDSWLTKKQAEVWKLTTDKGLTVYATPNHKFLVRHSGPGSRKSYIELQDLKPGTPLMPLTRYIKGGNWTIALHDGEDTRMPEHIWMAAELGLDTDQHIHHMDHDHFNNVASNLVALSHEDHSRHHGTNKMAEGIHPFQHLTDEQKSLAVEGWKGWYYGLSDEDRELYWQKVSAGKSRFNRERVASGVHNFIANPPMRDPAKVHQANRNRIATTAWKVLTAGLPITEEAWETSTKDAGLYNSQRFSTQFVLDTFGGWDDMTSYLDARNHRVVSAEFSHFEDVYDVEVPGPHNFVVCDENRRGVVVSNSQRRGANMGTFSIYHPDSLDFINSKLDRTTLNNFNISVLLDKTFFSALEMQDRICLSFPTKSSAEGSVHCQSLPKHSHQEAALLFDAIATNAWTNGEPGVLFIDKINDTNPHPELYYLNATNPCGEQALGPWESCVLGSINLANYIRAGRPDWTRLRKDIPLYVEALDRMIDVARFPIQKIADATRLTRRIGLGVMGWADMLYSLRIPYNSQAALDLAQEVGSFIHTVAREASICLAKKLGPYPLDDHLRNAAVTTVAPTGTLSILANCSSGIEPVFAHEFVRQHRLDKLNPDAVTQMFDGNKQVADWLADNPGAQTLPDYFVTSHEVLPSNHIKMQSVWQQYFADNAISKTINAPHSATLKNVKESILQSFHSHCKGWTYYRDGSRDNQVLSPYRDCNGVECSTES